jgi:hypothetical protein
MNKLQVYFVQEASAFEYRLELNKINGKIDKKMAEQVLCGALAKFFSFVGTLKFCGGKGVKLSLPFNFIITTGENEMCVFDGMESRQELTATLKLQNTCKSRKRFAARAIALMNEAAVELKLRELDELNAFIGDD